MHLPIAVTIPSLFMVVSLLGAGGAQKSLTWTSDTFPNPHFNPQECGRPENKRAWVCDPNGIITYDEARILDQMLENIASNGLTKCPCSASQCGSDTSGYKIAIALMKKITLDGRDTSKEAVIDAARKFAYDLMMNKWHYGSCEENVVILFSQDDNILYVMSGDTAKLKLTDDYLTIITDDAGPHFARGRDVSVGLKNMVNHFRSVFNNHFYPDAIYNTYGKGSATLVNYALSLILLSLTTIFLI